MRGKGMHTTKASPDQRITPAYAGKRTGLICKYPLVRDHPRLCGEKDRANKKMHVVQGSPPPMRGKEVIKATKNLPARITPAYAGKSAVVELLLITRQDHPRLCGEKPFSQDIFPPVPGSPPPMRGKEKFANTPDHCFRITPAYAGKRSACVPKQSQIQDHPRLCGEKPNQL